jgi:hypothetical protein
MSTKVSNWPVSRISSEAGILLNPGRQQQTRKYPEPGATKYLTV